MCIKNILPAVPFFLFDIEISDKTCFANHLWCNKMTACFACIDEGSLLCRKTKLWKASEFPVVIKQHKKFVRENYGKLASQFNSFPFPSFFFHQLIEGLIEGFCAGLRHPKYYSYQICVVLYYLIERGAVLFQPLLGDVWIIGMLWILCQEFSSHCLDDKIYIFLDPCYNSFCGTTGIKERRMNNSGVSEFKKECGLTYSC